MEKQTKDKIKIGAGVGVGGVLLGFIQGAGVDHILADKIIDALKSGDIKNAMGFIAIFLLIWLQVKGLKDEVKAVRVALTDPNAPIAISFAQGAARMDTIEAQHSHDQVVTENALEDHEERIKILEQFRQQQSQGGNYGSI